MRVVDVEQMVRRRVPPVDPIGCIASRIASIETACGKLYLPPPPTEEIRHIFGLTASTSSRLTPRLEAWWGS